MYLSLDRLNVLRARARFVWHQRPRNFNLQDAELPYPGVQLLNDLQALVYVCQRSLLAHLEVHLSDIGFAREHFGQVIQVE